MFISRTALACAFTILSGVAAAQQGPRLGAALTPDEIGKIDITVETNGAGLPPGSGSVERGAEVYAKKCQSCHGAQGSGKPQDALTGGVGSLATARPVKTVASFWPRATTLFDYIRRAMPISAPRSLSDEEVYAVTAYILSVDNIVPAGAVLDAKTLPQVRMPNRDGFVSYWPLTQKPVTKKPVAKK